MCTSSIAASLYVRDPVHTFVMKQIGCRGDNDPGEVGDRSQTLAMAIEVDPLALPKRAKNEIVLKGGPLEAPKGNSEEYPDFDHSKWPAVTGGGGGGDRSSGRSGRTAAED